MYWSIAGICIIRAKVYYILSHIIYPVKCREIKSKVKLSFSMPCRHYRGSRGIAPLIPTSALDEGEWSTSCFGRLTLSKEPLYPLNRRVSGPHSLFLCFGEQFCASTGIWTLDSPTHSLVTIPNMLSWYVDVNSFKSLLHYI
jgi:hypothetical protein